MNTRVTHTYTPVGINIVDPVEVGINTAARTHARLRERERERERERGRASLVVHRIAAAAASGGRGRRQYSSTQACTHARTHVHKLIDAVICISVVWIKRATILG